MDGWIVLLVFFVSLFFILKLTDNELELKILNIVAGLNLSVYILLILLNVIKYFSFDTAFSFFSTIYFVSTAQSVFLFIIVYFFQKSIKIYFNPRIKICNLFKIIFLTLLIVLLKVFIVMKLDLSAGNALNDSKTINLLSATIFYCLLPAIFEEMFFRGLIYDKLIKIYSPNKTIVITSFLFYMAHLIEAPPLTFIWIFPIGLFFGYVKSKYKNIGYSIASHFLFNFVLITFNHYYL